MTTSAQIAANRANAQFSTGPRTPEGKAAVARNHLTHGLSANAHSVLPFEDKSAFEALLEGLRQEHAPQSITEEILVFDMARSQWKLQRIAGMECALLAMPPGGDGATHCPVDAKQPLANNAPDLALAERFRQDCSTDEALLKLNRYENSARRAFYKALAGLRQLRKDRAQTAIANALNGLARFGHADARQESAVARTSNPISPPVTPAPRPHVTAANNPNCSSNPMPDHLRKELANHKRRDPGFDPVNDRTQMSKQLQRWFQEHTQ